MTPEETRERLLYRDGLMLVLDKPAGVAVHAGPKGGASLQDDFDALRFGLPRNPALAHRLDRDTAGCLVLGRHHKALEKLGLLFKQGKIAKTYWAIVAGAPEDEEGTIDLALGRLDDKIGWWMKVDPKGQKSLTLWRVMGRGTWRGAPIAWLELEPKTGRTHQLRVHCASQGWPIFGDGIYGERADLPLQLLARKVIVPLSKSKPPIEVEASAPPHMLEALAVGLWERRRGLVGAVVDRAATGPALVGAVHSPSLDGHPTGRPLDRASRDQRSRLQPRRLCGAADCERVVEPSPAPGSHVDPSRHPSPHALQVRSASLTRPADYPAQARAP